MLDATHGLDVKEHMSMTPRHMLSSLSLLLQSIAETYAAEGATVVLTARSEDQLAEAGPLEMHH